jgi:hypothetical protein
MSMEEIQEIVCTFATETWFINGVFIQDAFIYCGLSGGTRRDTECLFLAFTPTAIHGLLFTT